MSIKTHFNYTDEQGVVNQIALGSLPYVPRAGETIMLISQDEATKLWSKHVNLRVEKVSYEMFGHLLPVSRSWENNTDGSGCQVVLDVTPLDEEAQAYVQEAIAAFQETMQMMYGQGEDKQKEEGG